MTTAHRNDPYRGFNFRLEIDGVVQAAFQECSGLDREAVEDDSALKLPGLHKTGDVTLKRGVIDSAAFVEWVKAASDAKTQRRNGSIILTDERNDEKARWNFRNGWPTKWTGPTLNAEPRDVAIETLEIAHEGLIRA
jgi:phage tail-like protein